MLNRFIEQLSKELRWTKPVEKEEDGSYHLLFESNLNVNIKQNDDAQITLTSTLGSVPDSKQDEFFLKLMTANLLGLETGGSHLGLDVEGKNVVFRNFLLAPFEYKRFKETLEDFINYTEVWQDETKKMAISKG